MLSIESVNKVLNRRQSIRFIVSRTFRSTIGRMLSVVLLSFILSRACCVDSLSLSGLSSIGTCVLCNTFFLFSFPPLEYLLLLSLH